MTQIKKNHNHTGNHRKNARYHFLRKRSETAGDIRHAKALHKTGASFAEFRSKANVQIIFKAIDKTWVHYCMPEVKHQSK